MTFIGTKDLQHLQWKLRTNSRTSKVFFPHMRWHVKNENGTALFLQRLKNHLLLRAAKDLSKNILLTKKKMCCPYGSLFCEKGFHNLLCKERINIFWKIANPIGKIRYSHSLLNSFVCFTQSVLENLHFIMEICSEKCHIPSLAEQCRLVRVMARISI